MSVATRYILVLFVSFVLLSACAGSPAATLGPTAVPATTMAPPPTTAPTATSQPTPTTTVAPSAAPTQPATVEITVYFTDSNLYAAGTPPFEVAVSRVVPAGTDLPEAVLRAFFEGPTDEERAQGLEAITSGFTSFRDLQVLDGIARVYLDGPCLSHGATYTVAQPILKNLLQFEGIRYVKIYDAEGLTGDPEGATNSIPPCLEP